MAQAGDKLSHLPLMWRGGAVIATFTKGLPNSKPVWHVLISVQVSRQFFSVSDVVLWINSNISSKAIYNSLSPLWKYVFRQTVHVIWSNHIAGVHGAHNFLEDHYVIAERSLQMVLELLSAWNKESILV